MLGEKFTVGHQPALLRQWGVNEYARKFPDWLVATFWPSDKQWFRFLAFPKKSKSAFETNNFRGYTLVILSKTVFGTKNRTFYWFWIFMQICIFHKTTDGCMSNSIRKSLMVSNKVVFSNSFCECNRNLFFIHSWSY